MSDEPVLDGTESRGDLDSERTSMYTNKVVFRTSDVMRLTERCKISARNCLVDWFSLPGSPERRCTRNSVQNLLDRLGIEKSLGCLTESFTRERRRIIAMQEISAERIAFLLQVDRKVVNKWMKRIGLAHREEPRGNFTDRFSQRADLLRFMSHHGIPLEIAEGYTEDRDGGDGVLGYEDILRIFALYLCDGRSDLAEMKLDVQLQTNAFPQAKGEGVELQIPRRDISDFLKQKTGHTLRELQSAAR